MAIVYMPGEKMWDTWIYQYEGEYHLFFLSDGRIGRAVSKDLIHWDRLPPIENMASADDWDADGMKMTGSVARVGDAFYLCYGSGDGTPVGMIVSDDLLSWRRVGEAPILPSASPYKIGSHWRDLSAYYDEQAKVWNGYLFAIDEKSGRPAIAQVTSENYLSWSYQEPAFVSDVYSPTNDGFVFLEVPDYFVLGDVHYLLFSSVRSRKRSTSGRKDAAGTWYLMAEKRNGPWRVPARPLLLGSGRGRYDHYVGRTTTFAGQTLLYHHTWGHGPVSWATPKKVVQNGDGSLSLEYWSRLDTLVEKTLLHDSIVTVEADPGKSALQVLDVSCADFMFTGILEHTRAEPVTLLWHIHRGPMTVASGLDIDARNDTISVSEIRYDKRSIDDFNGNTYLRYRRDDIVRSDPKSQEIHIRIISRAHQVEIYIDDGWVFSMDMSDLPSKGTFGLLADSGSARLKEVTISVLEDLPGATE